MSHPARVVVALEMLQATGIWRSNYAPPLHRLLLRAGLAVPPSHMASFVANLAFAGAWFGSAWGLAMWLLLWSGQGMPGVAALGVSAVASALFGLVMAVYYRHSAQKHSLPRWSEVEATQ
jgi:hypothetical protein